MRSRTSCEVFFRAGEKVVDYSHGSIAPREECAHQTRADKSGPARNHISFHSDTVIL